MQPRRYAGFGVLLVASSLAVFVMTNTAFFRVQEIAVTGAVKVSPHEVVALSRLERGQHMFAFKSESVRSLVMTHPWIRSAAVGRRFPGVVEIVVTERTPLACVPYHNGFLTVDEDARVLEFAAGGKIAYPVITGWSPASAAEGDFIRSAGMLAGLRCVQAASPKMRDRISEVAVERDQTVVLYLIGGLRVYFGQADAQAEKRFNVLESVLEDISHNKIDALYVDLRFGNPVIKTKK
jgi:cell division protein FtsQ